MSLNQKRIRVPSLFLPLLLLGVADHGAIALAQSPGTFTATGNMLTARFAHTATLLPDGKVLIAGGCTDGPRFSAIPPFCRTVTATAEIYDPATGTFMATGNMTSPRAYHTATVLPDGRVLIAAGRVGDGGADDDLTSAELYDPSTGVFSATGPMNCKGAWTSTLLSDGRFLISGSCVELYDPSVGKFTATPGRGGSTTLLGDGRVLFASPFFTFNSLYDPGTGTFSPTSPMVDLEWARGPVTGRAILLLNGRVLVVGGNSDPGPATGAELYDNSTEQFVATGDMSAARANHTATLLLDGKALITGGSTWISSPPGLYHVCCLASAELYDAATGLFAETGRMAAGRTGHTATQLTSGKVLIAGGSGGSDIGALGTAELYRPAMVAPAPVLLSLSGDGQGQGAIWHAITGEISSPDSPAVAGEVLSMYTTSLNPGGVIPPQVAIGGRLAEILYFGDAPGYPEYDQVNFRVPNGVASGPTVSVRLTYLGRPSNEVTIGVR